MNNPKPNEADSLHAASSADYVTELRGILKKWGEAHPQKWSDGRDQGSLELCRLLHLELCKASGMGASEAVDDWNRRCPEEPWIVIIPPSQKLTDGGEADTKL